MTVIIVGYPATGSPHNKTLSIIHAIYNNAHIDTNNPIIVAIRNGVVVKLDHVP